MSIASKTIASALPRAAGIGFKAQHFDDILSGPQPIGFVEIHAENYMGEGGEPHAQLRALCERYALSVHGVGLSIGGAQPLDRAHLRRLGPPWLSPLYVPGRRSGELSHFSRFLGFRRIRAELLDGGDEPARDFGTSLGIQGAGAELALAEAYGNLPPFVTADENEGVLAGSSALPPPHLNRSASSEVLQGSPYPELAGIEPRHRRAE